MAARGWHQAAQNPADPASIASQLLADVVSYYTFPTDTASSSTEGLSFYNQPSLDYCNSLAANEPAAFACDLLGRRIRPIKPYALSPGINQGFVPPPRHGCDFPCGPPQASLVVQSQARPLPQHIPKKGKTRKETVVKPRRKSSSRSRHQPGPSIKAGSHDRASDHQSIPFVPRPIHQSLQDAAAQSTTSQSPTSPTNNLPATFISQTYQNTPSSISNSHEYQYVEYGQKDPTKRSLDVRSAQDKERRNAITDAGGACSPCQYSRKRCDESRHCHRCVEKGVVSEADFLWSLRPPLSINGLQDVSLNDMQSPEMVSSARRPEADGSTRRTASNPMAKPENLWFRNATRMIDSDHFSVDIFQDVSITITSGTERKRETCFNLDFLEICSYMEQKAFSLEEAPMVAGFGVHIDDATLPPPAHDRWGSRCAAQLSRVVSNVFAFLRSFADADLFGSINSMPTARVTISVIYVSLYRLLLSKCHDLCFFILKSLEENFIYCTRRSREDLIKDSLRGLAQYYRVVTGIAKMELRSSPEIAALFGDLESHARAILRTGSLEDLFVKIHAKTLPKAVQLSSEAARTKFQELLPSCAAEVPGIECLKVALSVVPQQPNLRPVPTAAIRDNDPHHHFRPIKVRDLLKGSDDISKDAKQSFVDNFVTGFELLGYDGPSEPPSAGYLPGFYLDDMNPHSAGGSTLYNLSTSLNTSHASLRPSQQDTDTGSGLSESTVQDEIVIHQRNHGDAEILGEQVHNEWHTVLREKGCKRRERSDDSQNSRRHSGQGGRKHRRYESGRQSPNRYGPLTDEPTALP